MSQQTSTLGGDVAITGAVTANSLTVPGLSVTDTGAVQITGARASYTQDNLTNGSFSQTAATDGLVVAVLGTVSANVSVQFAGMLQASTLSGETITSTLVTAASTIAETYSNGKKGTTTLQIPIFGNLSMPVRQGETWTLTLTSTPSGSGYATPNLLFYWVPLGSAASSGSDGGARTSSDEAVAALNAEMQSLQTAVNQGAVGSVTAESMAETQRLIEERMDDFARVLGDATGMSTAAADRAAFLTDLRAIVCRSSMEGTVAGDSGEASLNRMADTFSRVTGRPLTADRHELLKSGIRALVAINASEANRRDLDLIRTNIALFIDIVSEVLDVAIGASARRLLTRALVRLVGDGATRPDAEPVMVAAE